MSDFDRWIALLTSFEGGAANRASDRGGPTGILGVTESLLEGLHSHGQHLEIQFPTLTQGQARMIAQDVFWEPFSVFPWPLSLVLADWGYNSGPSHPIEALQAEVGATIDGQLGPDTLDKTQHVVSILGASHLAGAVQRRRGQFLSHLVKSDVSQLANLGGWWDRSLRILLAFVT